MIEFTPPESFFAGVAFSTTAAFLLFILFRMALARSIAGHEEKQKIDTLVGLEDRLLPGLEPGMDLEQRLRRIEKRLSDLEGQTNHRIRVQS